MTGTILLTGATGFVGRQVLNELDERSLGVRAIIRAGKQKDLSNRKVVESIRTTQDLFSENADWWARVCEGVDTVVHVAWYVEPGKYLQSERNLDCLIGTLQLAKGAADARVRRFIGIGTCFEYDLTQGILSVDTPLRPLTPYAGAKAATYFALSQWLSQRRIEFAWCRLFYLYGEGEDGRRLVPYLRAKLAAGEPAYLTSGDQIRDFLDVRKAAQIIVDTALGDIQGPVNICSGVPITVRQLAQKVAEEYDRLDLLNFIARPDNLVDPPYVVGLANLVS
jgi:nucleoside-diphosphate-sugar epimerase